MKTWCRTFTFGVMIVCFVGVAVVVPEEVHASTVPTGEAVQVEAVTNFPQLLTSLQTLLRNLKAYVSRKSFIVGTCMGDWQQANQTWFSSYPEQGSDECHDYNGCEWAGKFAGVEGTQSEIWAATHNIVAVHEDFYDEYKGKWLVIRDQETRNNIKAQVLDMCSDSDCDGCCTRNMKETGFLIDLEKYTAERFFGADDLGNTSVDWCVSR